MSVSTDSTGKDLPLSLETARRCCREEETRALREEWNGVLAALMAMGKSSGVPHTVAETGKLATVLVGLGFDQELYDEYLEWSNEAGISAKRIPSSSEDCPSFDDNLKTLYNRGVSPSTAHKELSLSCMPNCPYLEGIQEINENPSDYDLLIGHYNHAHFPKAVVGRSVFIDEFDPNSFETTVKQQWISDFLQSRDGLPFDSYTDLIETRSDDDRRRAARSWFEENGLTPSEAELLRNDDLWGIAPVAVWGLLTSRDLGNGWEISSFHEFDVTRDLEDMANGYKVAFDRRGGDDDDHISVLQTPPLHGAKNVIGLDGTPTMELWATVFPRLYEQRQVLTDEERRSYITDALGHRYVRTTPYRKAYSSEEDMIDDRVNVENDMALLEGIAFREGERPGLTTTKRAKEVVYDNHSVDDLVDGVETFPVLGSNKFKDKRVGANIGYQHFGDPFIERWAAYAGKAVESIHDGRSDYGDYGNRIFNHFKNQTLQANMRFGRNEDSSTVYTHTDTLPDWVPVAATGEVCHLSDDRTDLRSVIDAAMAYDGEWFTASELVDDSDFSKTTALKWLHRLYDGGYVDCEEIEDETALVWRDFALGEIEYGILVIT